MWLVCLLTLLFPVLLVGKASLKGSSAPKGSDENPSDLKGSPEKAIYRLFSFFYNNNINNNNKIINIINNYNIMYCCL